MEIPADMLDQIAQRKLTVRAASATLQISQQYLYRLLKKSTLSKTPSKRQQRLEKSDLFQARRDFRLALAAKIRAHSCTLEQAAAQAKCSVRTIRRYLDELKWPSKT